MSVFVGGWQRKRRRSPSWACGALLVALSTMPARAINLNLSSADIEVALAVGRGSDAERTRFHSGYLVRVTAPVVERLEVITETRRLVLMTEQHIRAGDHLFSRSTRPVRDALAPWKGKVAVSAQLRFHPQNVYIGAPQIEIVLGDAPTPAPVLDTTSSPLLGFPGATPGQRLPVLGAMAEALFDAAIVGQTTRSVTVRVDGEVVARASIDFSRLP